MKKLFTSLLSAIIMCSMLFTVAFSEDVEKFEDPVGNKYLVGTKVELEGNQCLDAFSAGNIIMTSGNEIQGNLFAAGNMMNISENSIGSSLIIAGNQMTVSGNYVVNNIFAAGSKITLSDTSAVSIYLAGDSIEVDGGFFEYANISGGTVVINSQVDGDVCIEAENVIIGDEAVILGELKVISDKDAEISSSAEVGKYVFDEVKNNNNSSTQNDSVAKKILGKISSAIYWIIALGIVGVLLCIFFNKQLDESVELIVSRTGAFIGTGALMLIAVPMACIIAAITVVGLPLSGFVFMIYMFMIFAGSSFAGASLGRLAFPRIGKMLASLIGIAIFMILDIIPIIGAIASIAADMYFMGYVGQKLYANIKK